MSDLDRFKAAQRKEPGGFVSALSEIREGRKRSHWTWFVFPQLRGLGSSPEAVEFGLDGVEEAMAYLRDGELRARVLAISTAVAAHALGPAPTPLAALMGSRIDVLKLVSSMTLFEHAARRLLATDRSADLDALARSACRVLSTSQSQGLPPCAFTRSRLGDPARGM